MESLNQLAIIWCGVFFAVYAAKKTRLTSVLFLLFVGAVLVNLGILPTESSEFITTFAELGIIVIMFALGFEENTSDFISSMKRSWRIAFFGAIAPFATAYACAFSIWGNVNIAIICGLTMTATAVSLTMVSLKNEGLNHSHAATGIMTSAVIDDIASLALVAILIPIASGEAATAPTDIFWIMIKAIGFFAIVALLASFILPNEPRGVFSKVPYLNKFGVRSVLKLTGGEHSTLVVLLIALCVGLIAHHLGFHPAVGAYMAGLILKEEYFQLNPNKSQGHYHNLAKTIDNIAFSWIGPIFFVELGTKILLDVELLLQIAPYAVLFTAAIFTSQVLSAGLAARYTGGFSRNDSILIGFGMLGRAELAFVVLNIAYVQHRIITEHVFYTLMVTAFLLNVSVPITIRWWKSKYQSLDQRA